jgi:two-component SAPR family response regulator
MPIRKTFIGIPLLKKPKFGIDYQQAFIQPDNRDMLVIVARVFEEIDNIQGAIQTHQRLLELDPEMIYAQKSLEKLTK